MPVSTDREKKRCRIHGGKSPAPRGKADGNFTTGTHTAEVKLIRALAVLAAGARQSAEKL
jgi:hypothetical protein